MNTIQLNTENTKMTRNVNNQTVNGKHVVALVMALALSVGFMPSRAGAAFSEKDAGTRGAQFLKLPVSARAIGMGEAYTAIADDANAIYYNVAGLASAEKKSAEYMYSSLMMNNKASGESNPGYHWIAFGMPISEAIGAAGIAIQYFSAGDIKKTDIRAADQGTFSPSDMAVNLSYARKVMGYGLGANLKIINSKIDNSATAVAVDLGARDDKMLDGKLLLGFAVQNLGSSLKYETEDTKLPILIKLGSGYKVMENWIAALDVVFPEDNSAVLAVGTDYKHKISEDMDLSGRLGYNSRNRKVDGFNGVTLGLGFGFKVATFDIAWMPMGDLGQTLRFSIGAKF